MRAATLVVRRELTLESVGRDASATVVPFIIAGVLMAGLAMGPVPRVLETVAPAVTWLVVLFATPTLARSVAAAERDEGTWDMLRGLVGPGALVAGKIGGLWVHLLVAWGLTATLVALMFPAPLPAAAVLAGPLGTLGLAALTTAFGALLVGERRRAGLLAVLLLPLSLPVLLAGSALATPGGGQTAWLALLVGYDALILVAVWAVCPTLLEE